RTTGAAISPALSAPLIASGNLMALPFLIAGGLKIVYDLALWAAFRAHPAPEERTA
ncbi:MAG: major facilitator superfamily 1 transporter, partial [Chloroflexi bacterium]|nr:major facilitator superfamily 1 transporter [Chloroflexota bacterium]